jgi:hypothetical protein
VLDKIKKYSFSIRSVLIIILGISIGVVTLKATTFYDTFRAFGPVEKGIRDIIEAVELFHKANSSLVIHPFAKRFREYVEKSMDEFDFMQLYDSSYLKKRDTGFRTVTIHGINASESYNIYLSHSSYDSGDFSRLGNTKLELGLRKNNNPVEGERSFEASLKLKSAFHHFSHQKIANFMDILLKIIEPLNIRKLSPDPSRTFANINDESRRVIDEFSHTYPSFAKFLDKYTYLKSLLRIKYHNNKPYTEFKLTGALKIPLIERDFPELASWLDDIKYLFQVQFFLNNEHGNNIIKFFINPENSEITWIFLTAGGKILARDKKGKPIFNQGISFKTHNEFKFYTISSFYANIYGLKFRTGNIIIFGKYKITSDRGRLFIKVTKIPKFKVEGYFYHVIPKWLIDLSIPGNIEELTEKFCNVLVKARSGKGTNLDINLEKKKVNMNILTAQGDSEFLDNRFIRIVLKIWSRRFRPHHETEEDLRKLFAEMSKELILDLRKLKK